MAACVDALRMPRRRVCTCGPSAFSIIIHAVACRPPCIAPCTPAGIECQANAAAASAEDCTVAWGTCSTLVVHAVAQRRGAL
ncbi:hypothetical protein EON66_06450 [archaeon]|nr:MAG: hypothetical protein EON66_06450 [archaeon]